MKTITQFAFGLIGLILLCTLGFSSIKDKDSPKTKTVLTSVCDAAVVANVTAKQSLELKGGYVIVKQNHVDKLFNINTNLVSDETIEKGKRPTPRIISLYTNKSLNKKRYIREQIVYNRSYRQVYNKA